MSAPRRHARHHRPDPRLLGHAAQLGALDREAVELCGELRPRVTIPVHYEGWTHFREGRAAIERAFAAAPDAVRASVRWLPIGEAVDVADDPATRA